MNSTKTSSIDYLTDKQIKLNTKIRIENLEMNLELMSEFLENTTSYEALKGLAKTLLNQAKTLKENI